MSTAKLYVIYDEKAENVLGQILTSPRAAAATRQFTELLNSKETIVGQHPADFTLLEIGSIDLTTGIITPDNPELIYSGKKWLQEESHLINDANAANSSIRMAQEAAK
jgi:hypothetical protein